MESHLREERESHLRQEEMESHLREERERVT